MGPGGAEWILSLRGKEGVTRVEGDDEADAARARTAGEAHVPNERKRASPVAGGRRGIGPLAAPRSLYLYPVVFQATTPAPAVRPPPSPLGTRTPPRKASDIADVAANGTPPMGKKPSPTHAWQVGHPMPGGDVVRLDYPVLLRLGLPGATCREPGLLLTTQHH